MSLAVAARRGPTSHRAAFWLIVASKLVAGWGLAWDIQWHVTIGRDSFWIAPHVMIYVSVAVAFVIGFAVLARDTFAGAPRDTVTWRLLGFTSTRGFHLAAWGMAAVVLAAPIDDLWHRLFGIDVTLWSPPHLLGLAGSAVNTLGTLVIACEVYPSGSRLRLAATLITAAQLYGAVRILLDPTYLLAFTYGGVLFHAFAMLAALVLPLALVVGARLVDRRWSPVAILVLAIVLGITGEIVSSVGFAILQPESVISEEIRKDPTSSIAQANEITRRNRGGPPPWARLIPILAVAAMAIVDPRRRPLIATTSFAVVLFALSGWYLTIRPAFQPMIPGPGETAVALGLTLAAAAVGATIARGIADRLDAPVVPRVDAVLARPLA